MGLDLARIPRARPGRRIKLHFIPTYCPNLNPIERCASPSRPSRVSSNVTITSTAAMAPSIFSSASTCIGLGARSPSGGRQKTTPNACANSPMSIIPMPSPSGLCRTTCRPTRLVSAMRHSLLPKPGEFCAAWSSTTPQTTPAGSTWSRSRSACSAASVWTAESTTPSASSAKSQHGNDNETPPAPASNGCSQPTKPAPKWAAPIPSRFEGTYSTESRVRRGAVARPTKANSTGKIAALLVVLVVGASTAAGALTATLRANGAKSDEVYAPRYIKLPTVAHFEDALY